MGCSLFTVMCLCIWVRKKPNTYRWPYALAGAFFLLNLALFHFLRLISFQLPISFYNNWSLAIHLYVAILMSIVSFVMVKDDF